jgi:hypothetical protein
VPAPLQRGSAPGAAGPTPLRGFLNAFGFQKVRVPAAHSEPASILAAFANSETFRWLRRWAVVAVVAIVTPLTVITAYADEMPDFHRTAVPLAIVGFEQAFESNGGFGLRGIHERVERLGGTLRIDTSPGAGTRVHVEVPR